MSGVDLIARGLAARANTAIRVGNRHARLLRAADAAAGRNPAVLPAWLDAPAYAANTSYAVGQVVTSNGAMYICGIAGTSPASGGGPTSTSGQYVPDGSGGLYWSYLGGARASDAGDGAPIVSIATSNPNLGANWTPGSFPGAYAVRGAAPAPHRGSFWSLSTFETKAGVKACAGASVCFDCDGDRVAIFMPSNSAQVRVIVDGRYLMPGSNVVGGADQWFVIDWTGSTGRRLRRYEVETGKSASYFGCAQTSTQAMVSASDGGEPRMVMIGDSYNAGSSYGPWLAGGSIAQLLAKRLGWRDAWNLSVGGTGYLNASAGFHTYRQRIPQVLALNPDIVMLMGSTNDVGYPPAAVQAEVRQTLAEIRSGTSAPVVVIGVPSINVPGAAATEAAVAAAVAEVADPFTFFIPICGAQPPWVVGGWNNAGTVPSGSSNAGLYIAADNVHPPEIGFDLYAQRVEMAVRASVLPALALAG